MKYGLATATLGKVKTMQIWDLAINLKAPGYGYITRPARVITGRKTGSCGILNVPTADTKQHCGPVVLKSVSLRHLVAV